MSRLRFDPVRIRLARDIRNNLSKSLLKSLAAKDRSPFQRCGAAYLQQHLEPVYAMYVTKRLEKYEEAFNAIEVRGLREVFQQAAEFWDLGLYYEMHELLEPIWKEADGARRRALQGLIQAAGMKIHAESNNNKAAASMGSKALAALRKYGGELEGFSRLEAVLRDLMQNNSSTQETLQDT